MQSCVKSERKHGRQVLLAAILGASCGLAQDLTGIWQGKVTNPDTQQELRTVLKIASSEGDPIKANFYSIDQTYLVFPATLTLQAGAVKLSIPGIGATYQGKLGPDGNTLSGTLKGFSSPINWTMKRVSEAEAWPVLKPPDPPKPMPANADPAFEVVTVKPSRPDATGRGLRVRGSDVSLLNWKLMELATFAYDLHPHQVIGAPSWSTSDRFDIAGKSEPEGEPSQDQFKVMLQKLLADRFQLRFHKEQRELPVFTLSVAKGGAKISKNDGKNQTTGIIFRSPGSVLLNNVTMDDLSKMLQSGAVDRPVVNQTGISGKYDFSLVWTPDQIATAPRNPNALGPNDRADLPPDLATAIQEQLGLKLEATKLRIDVLVVDKIEKPSEN